MKFTTGRSRATSSNKLPDSPAPATPPLATNPIPTAAITSAQNNAPVEPPLKPSPEPSPKPEGDLELRQVGGLMAGETMKLHPGPYDFGFGASGTMSFSLEVGLNYSVDVVPGPSGIWLDCEHIRVRTPLANRTINAGTARFRVGHSRPTQRDRREIISAGTPQIRELSVSVLQDAGQTTQGPANQDVSQANTEAGRPSQFVDRLLSARQDLATQLTNLHPDPEEVAHRARHGRGLSWHRRSDHWHFGQVSIATADIAWQPRLDKPEDLTDYSQGILRAVSVLPSVPVAVDLRVGPLGIVGSRAAMLACARHIISCLATLSSPEYLAVTILSAPNRAESWSWAQELPHVTSGSSWAKPLLVVDGVDQIDDNGFGMALTDPGGIGPILLAEDLASLPPVCANVMILDESGTAAVLNHRDGRSISRSTPHGISMSLAEQIARNLRLLSDDGSQTTEPQMALAPDLSRVSA